MKKSILWILVPVAVVALAWLLSGGSEEQRILERLEQIRNIGVRAHFLLILGINVL